MKKLSLLIASALAASSLMAAAPMTPTSSANTWGYTLGYGAFSNDTSSGVYGFNYDTGAYSLKLGMVAMRVDDGTSSPNWFNGANFVGSVDRSYPLSGSTKHVFGLGGTVEAQAPSTVNLQDGYNPYSIMSNYGITTMFAPKVRFEYKQALLGYTDFGNTNPRREWSILGNGGTLQITKFF